MTRPTSRLEWFGNDLDPLGIGAIWIGSGWDYTLYWGHLNPDGTPAKTYRSAFAGPARHTYPQPGEYTLLAVSELNKVQVSDKVVVRGERSPQFTVDDLGGGRVRLTLKGWPVATWHRVIWNVGEKPEDFTDTQLTPEHTYPPGVDTALITVIDVPARRTATRTVHLDPAPPPGETRWWFEEVPGDTDHPILHVGGLTPGAQWTVRDSGLGHNVVGSGTVSSSGHISQRVEMWSSDTIRNPWWVWNVLEANGGQERRLHPIYYYGRSPDQVYPVYDWSADDPGRIVLSVCAPTRGTYSVDFGDGTPPEHHHSDGVALHVEHRYTTPGEPYTVRVTDPAGNTGLLALGPCLVEYSGFNGRYWLDFMYSQLPDWPNKTFALAITDWDDGNGPMQRMVRASSLNDGTKKIVTGHIYGKEHNGRQVTAVATAPWSNTTSKTVTIKEGLGRDFPLRLAAHFTITEQWDGGYSGEFTIRNRLTIPVSRWLLDFQLPAPAVINDSWPGTAQLERVGPGRYAITSDTNLDPTAETTVGIRVEHAGTPPLQPTDIRATTTKENDPVSQSTKAPVLVAGGYVNADRLVKLYLINLYDFMADARFQSPAFADDGWHQSTIVDDPDYGREAQFEARIGADIEPGEYDVHASFTHGFTRTFKLLVEPVSDGTTQATVAKVDNEGMMRIKVESLSRNVGRHLSKYQTGVEAATEMAIGGADGWFGLVYDWATGSAANNFVLSSKAIPGQTYDVKVKQYFHGGHSEILTGKVALPHDKPVRGELPLVFTHHIDTGKLGKGNTVAHVIEFGDDHEQPTARYGVAHELVVTSPSGGKPDLPDDIQAALRELRPLTVARAVDKVTLYGGNPPILRGNKNFRIKLVVTITPTASQSGYGDDGDGDGGDGGDPTTPDHR